MWRTDVVAKIITLAMGHEAQKETSEPEREKNRQRFQQVAQELYRWLLAPVEKGIRTEKLILAPHGVLHKVPFATLSDGRQALIERHAFSVLPAASLLDHLVQKRKPQKKSLLVLANPQTTINLTGRWNFLAPRRSNPSGGSERSPPSRTPFC